MRAPNRVLDLGELNKPTFRAVIDRMERLTAADPISYLHPSKRWEYPWALEQAELAPVHRVLDVGCGASIFPVYLAKQGYRVTAVDLDVPSELGNRHGVSIDYVRGNLGGLPFGERSFDRVFCISVIEHLGFEAMTVALGELHRVLRPGGRLLLTTDFYDDAAANITYHKSGKSFPVEWSFFDAEQLCRRILSAPGWHPAGEIDLAVDWPFVKATMREFHGYPYTSVGVVLVRE